MCSEPQPRRLAPQPKCKPQGRKQGHVSKIITSPIERWAGTVTISDPLTLPQAQAIEAGMTTPKASEDDGRIWLTTIDELKLPAVKLCVEEWKLENFTADPFPASPRIDSHKLIDWIFGELLTIYFGEALVPNASSPTLTDTQAKDSTPPK